MKIAHIFLATLLGVSSAAFAHPEHEETPAQPFKFHAAKNKSGVLIHVTDKGVKIPTAGASGKLVWSKGAMNGEALLEYAGDNKMQAKTAKLPAGTKMRASITFADKTVFTDDVHAK